MVERACGQNLGVGPITSHLVGALTVIEHGQDLLGVEVDQVAHRQERAGCEALGCLDLDHDILVLVGELGAVLGLDDERATYGVW